MEYEEQRVTEETTTSAEQFDAQTFFREHLVKTADGQLEVKGENLNPMELALLETEKRRRGSQAASSREKARALKLETELTKVKTNIREVKQPEPIDESLKYSDPDEYIRLKLEANNVDPYQTVFDTASREAELEVGEMTVQSVIAKHNERHPDKQLTPEMLEMDLPPRLMASFSSGQLSPSDFLAQAADILYRPTEIANQEVLGAPDLGKVGGQTTPSDDGSNDKMLANYANAVI